MELPNENDIEYNGIFSVIEYETIFPGKIPTKSKWAYPAMYKESQTGGILYWRIGFDGGSDEIVTEHGYDTTQNGDKGKLQVDRLKIYTNNLHKNIIDKALQDVRRAYEDKYKQGYSDESGNSIDLPKPQLANTYYLPGQSGRNPLSKYNFSRGLSVQPKLDGVRARAWRINGEIKIYSREFNLHPWLDTYIKPELNLLFDHLPIGVGIDGELYNNDMIFNELISVVRTKNTKHPKNDLLEFYVFDIVLLNTKLEDRIKILVDAYTQLTGKSKISKIFVLSNTPIYEESFIKPYHDEFVKMGYEGLMIRKLCGNVKLTKKQEEESWYKPGRNNNLLKVKSIIDEEGTVIDITEGEGREKELAMIVIKDIRGNQFTIRPRGSFDNRRKWLTSKKDYIGKKYTFRYQELSEYGVPRFPVGISFRDYE